MVSLYKSKQPSRFKTGLRLRDLGALKVGGLGFRFNWGIMGVGLGSFQIEGHFLRGPHSILGVRISMVTMACSRPNPYNKLLHHRV